MIADDQAALEHGFVSSLAAGRAVLLLGQNHSPALKVNALRDIAAALRREPMQNLREQLVDHLDPSDLPNIRRAFSLHSPTSELLGITQQPWSMVLTSAVDSVATEALRQATSSGRRLRMLFPAQTTGQLPRANREALTVVRLFGSIEEQEDRFLPPLDRRELRQRQRFDVAALLNRLPDVVGPYGALAIVGVDDDDWIDLDDLSLACSQLPERSVHWFGGTVTENMASDFGDTLVVHEDSFGSVLGRAAGSDAGRALEVARSALLRPGGRLLTLNPAGETSTPIRLTPEEWRNISQVGVLLDDNAISPSRALGVDEGREAFRSFLRHQQYVPDWESISRGFLFERDHGGTFVSEIERAIAALGSVRDRPSDGGPAGDGSRGSRLPYLLTGPPASGKSRLLHWLAFQLRLRGHAVLYLLTPAGRVHFESVERVCRVIEMKGASHVVVVADGLDESSYLQLNEHLASSGRNALLLGARSASQRDHQADDPREQSGFSQFRALRVSSRLSGTELERFTGYLADRGFGDVPIADEHMRDRYFLLLLYRLLPDARGSIHLSLGSEYDRLLSTLDEVQEESAEATNQAWADQLEDIRRALFPSATSDEHTGSPLAHITGGVNAVNLCLFCSQIGKPLPLDILLRTEGRAFLRSYPEFAAALEATALLHEVEIDNSGTVVLDADHAIVAQLTLVTVVPRRAEQLQLLAALVDAVSWDEAAFPGDRLDQDYCIEVLQAVGPRGVSEQEFQSPQSLQVVADLLARVRVDNGARLPRLLLLEANTLRLLANRMQSDYETALQRCDGALAVLDIAEQILLDRRPSAARNSELRNVLNTRATVHGFMAGNLLSEYQQTPARNADLRRQIFTHLAEVDGLAARSRGLGDPSFYPLDVTFWVYRDTFELLPDLSDEERVRLLARMETVLDSATEESIEANQLDRFRRRSVNLAQLEGNIELSESLAATMRDSGDFSGECLLVRRDVFEPRTRRVRSREAARGGLDRLESYGVAAFGSAEALDLMNHLWRAAYLPDVEIGGPDPVFAACSENEWLRWRRILEARIRLLGHAQHVFLGFCLSWTLFQLGESRLGLQEIRAVEPLSGGSRRRIGCLSVLTDIGGSALKHRAAVRRREGDAIVTYIAALRAEVRLAPAFAGRFPVFPRVGEEFDLEIGLNYRGLLPWRLL